MKLTITINCSGDTFSPENLYHETKSCVDSVLDELRKVPVQYRAETIFDSQNNNVGGWTLEYVEKWRRENNLPVGLRN